MIRVLHIFGQMNRGGAELRTLEIMPLMREMGVRFDFCTMREQPGPLDARIREMGGEVYPCRMSANRLSFARRFTQLLNTQRFDVVHSHIHLSSGWILHVADKAGVPGRVIHFRSTGDGRRASLVRRLYTRCMRGLADRHANAVLAVSEAAMESAWGPGWRADPRTRIIYNGINLDRFARIPDCKQQVCGELGLDPTCRLVAHVGRLVPAKGHELLLDAAARLTRSRQDVRFLLIGDGERRGEIEAMVKSHGLAPYLILLGERDDVPRLLQAADCSVLSSIREGLPGAVLESLAAKTPVVAVNLPSVLEIAPHCRMLHVVRGRDPELLSSAIGGVISQTTPLETPFPAIFDLHTCTTQWMDVYHSILPRNTEQARRPASSLLP